MRIEQTIGNLLQNASKYSDTGAKIRVTLDREDETAAVRIQDPGIGMSPETLSRAFDLFSQADGSLDRSHGGLGIGLTFARGIVELHGGSISASSAGPGRGSDFVIRLPISKEIVVRNSTPDNPDSTTDNTDDTDQPLPLDRGAAPPTGLGFGPGGSEGYPCYPCYPWSGGWGAPQESGVRALVVDDNRDAASSLADVLSSWGYETHIAHDGPSALALAEQVRPEVILLDLGLPGMSGFEVARHLVGAGFKGAGFKPAPTPASDAGRIASLISVSGYGRPEDRAESSAAGFDDHLVKPVDLDELWRLIRTS